MKAESIFEKTLSKYRKDYLEEDMNALDPQDKREEEDLKKVEGDVRKTKLKVKKDELQKLKKQEQQSRSNGSAL